MRYLPWGERERGKRDRESPPWKQRDCFAKNRLSKGAPQQDPAAKGERRRWCGGGWEHLAMRPTTETGSWAKMRHASCSRWKSQEVCLFRTQLYDTSQGAAGFTQLRGVTGRQSGGCTRPRVVAGTSGCSVESPPLLLVLFSFAALREPSFSLPLLCLRSLRRTSRAGATARRGFAKKSMPFAGAPCRGWLLAGRWWRPPSEPEHFT